jgi:hypothetical protein
MSSPDSDGSVLVANRSPLLTTTRRNVTSIAWSGFPSDVVAIDWSIGTALGTEDFLPATWVGPVAGAESGEGWAEIREGRLFVGAGDTAAAGEYLGDLEEIEALQAGEPAAQAVAGRQFALELGLCLYHRVRAYLESGGHGAILVEVCVLEDGDVAVTPINNTLSVVIEPGTASAARRRRDGPSAALRLTIEATEVPDDAVLLAGALSDGELAASTVAISAEYRAYIQPLSTLETLRSRSLWGRTIVPMGLAGFVSAPYSGMFPDPMQVTGHFPSSHPALAAGARVAELLVFDVGSGVWRQLWDSCGTVAPVRAVDSVSVPLCDTRAMRDRLYEAPNEPRRRALEADPFDSRAQLLLVALDPDFVNTAPQAKSASLEAEGAVTLVYRLQATDAEGDAFTFRLTRLPERGTALLLDGGTLHYTPSCEQCAPAEDVIEFEARETLQHEGEPLVSNVGVLRIRVVPKNRDPVLLSHLGAGCAVVGSDPVTGEGCNQLAWGTPSSPVRLRPWRRELGAAPLPLVGAADAIWDTLSFRLEAQNGAVSTLAPEARGLTPELVALFETESKPTDPNAPSLTFTFTTGEYRPKPGFVGEDLIAIAALDNHGKLSLPLYLQITVEEPSCGQGAWDNATGSCVCSPGWEGDYCDSALPAGPDASGDGAGSSTTVALAAAIAVLVALILLVIVIVVLRRRRRGDEAGHKTTPVGTSSRDGGAVEDQELTAFSGKSLKAEGHVTTNPLFLAPSMETEMDAGSTLVDGGYTDVTDEAESAGTSPYSVVAWGSAEDALEAEAPSGYLDVGEDVENGGAYEEENFGFGFEVDLEETV